MQDFVRTLDTTEAFKFKINMLENELKSYVEELDKSKKLLQSKQNEFDNIKFAGGWSQFLAKFNKIFGSICMLGLVVCIFLSFYFIKNDYDFSDYTLYSIGFGIVFMFVGIRCLVKVGFHNSKSREERIAAERKKEELFNDINHLKSSIKDLTVKIDQQSKLIWEQKNKFSQHMLNQEDLLEREVSAINTMKAPDEDTKECPQCAEIIKAKAKVCRFCSYKFE